MTYMAGGDGSGSGSISKPSKSSSSLSLVGGCVATLLEEAIGASGVCALCLPLERLLALVADCHFKMKGMVRCGTWAVCQ